MARVHLDFRLTTNSLLGLSDNVDQCIIGSEYLVVCEGSEKIMTAEIRQTGLENLPKVPPGTHLCQFYKTADDLLSVTLPFIKAGLENNEYCLWVAWEPMDTTRVMEVLASNLPDTDALFSGFQLEVASHCTPEFRKGLFCEGGLSPAVTERVKQAIAAGFDGLRIVDNLSWHYEADWSSLIEGERAAAEAMAEASLIALCSYPIDGCTGFQMKDIGSAHHYVLVSSGGQCEVIDGGLRAKDARYPRADTATGYKEVFENMLDGMVLLDCETMEGLLANDAAARLLGFDSAGDLVGINPFRSFARRGGQGLTPVMLRGLLHSEDFRLKKVTGVTMEGREVFLSSMGVRTEYQGRRAELITVRDMSTTRKLPRRSDPPRPRSLSVEVGA